MKEEMVIELNGMLRAECARLIAGLGLSVLVIDMDEPEICKPTVILTRAHMVDTSMLADSPGMMERLACLLASELVAELGYYFIGIYCKPPHIHVNSSCAANTCSVFAELRMWRRDMEQEEA